MLRPYRVGTPIENHQLTMTYLQFHLVFILPVIAVLAVWVWYKRPIGFESWNLWIAIPMTALIAFVYTIPWDNYLVYANVWYYGEDRVIGTVGYVPIEEYMFFILQPILTGLWVYALLRRRVQAERHPSFVVRIAGAGFWLILAGLGIVSLQFQHGTYLGLILVWACPVLAALWGWKGDVLWDVRRVVVVGVGIPTLYLWVADRIAIGLGIWTITPATSTGLMLVGLPIEEAIFFLLTNLLCVFSVLIFLNIWTTYASYASA